ncbi:MAG TPA: response regulator [Rectinemataceae bacterium]
MEDIGSFALGSGYHWVGSRQVSGQFQCNPYLLVDGDQALIFDPGSALDFEEVYANIEKIVPLENIKYIVLHHQDPDLASSVPLFEKAGLSFEVVSHWRTWSLVRFYGIQSRPYLVDEHGYLLKLGSGRILQFIGTPYLHFPGAIATYDRRAKTLLSSDLFGAFQSSWSLFAGPDYMEGMRAFHEHYMPSNEILKPVMDLFASLAIDQILPQHGSIIRENPKLYIEALASLDCGRLLGPAARRGGKNRDFGPALGRLFKRAGAIFGPDRAARIAVAAGLAYEPGAETVSSDTGIGTESWNKVADAVFDLEGWKGLSLIEPFVASLCAEFGLPRPKAYEKSLERSAEELRNLNEEVIRLREMNEILGRSAAVTQQNLMLDPVTGLNNESYFRTFIEEEVPLHLYSEGIEDDVLAVIGIDEGMARIEYQYGPKEVEAILKAVGRIILDSMRPGSMAFRLHGATFALWMPYILFHEANELCEEIRTKVESSRLFIEPITVSMGIVAVAEIRDTADPAEAGSIVSELGIKRLREARKRGGNTICISSSLSKDADSKGRILIVDDDQVNADVVKTFLENADYEVEEARDGDEALKKVSQAGFDLIISELMLPKIDGFKFKEALGRRTGTKDIPFILISHLKNENTVKRAYSLGVDHYLKKPYLLAELLGLVKNSLGSGTSV